MFGISYTLSGHLIGMLDRDQRTVRNARRRTNNQNGLDACPTCVRFTICEKSAARKDCYERRPCRAHRSMQRVKKVLAVVTYLLIVIPTALSAPSGYPNTGMESTSEPFFVITERVAPEGNVTPAQRQEAAKTIRTQAKINCNKATHALDAFTKHSFSMTPAEVNQRYQTNTYSWLPSKTDIPKQFGEELTGAITRTMEEEMVQLYEQFQKIGVGIDQIMKEYNNCTSSGEDHEICKNFKSIRDDLKALLRELNTHIGILGLTRRPDVSRDSMPAKDRNVDETTRRIRNWVIYRDYINALEYTIKAFDAHL